MQMTQALFHPKMSDNKLVSIKMIKPETPDLDRKLFRKTGFFGHVTPAPVSVENGSFINSKACTDKNR